MPSSIPLASNLRALRVARRLTVRALSLLSGIASRTIARIESGLVFNPLLSTIRKLADALRAPIAAFVERGVRHA